MVDQIYRGELSPPERADARVPIYLQWTPVLAGSIVAASLSFVLLSFASAIGLAVASPSSSWRDPDARDELADDFLRSTGADIREGHGEAHYVPSHDFISM